MRKKVGLDNGSLVEPFPEAKGKERRADLGKRKIKEFRFGHIAFEGPKVASGRPLGQLGKWVCSSAGMFGAKTNLPTIHRSHDYALNHSKNTEGEAMG